MKTLAFIAAACFAVWTADNTEAQVAGNDGSQAQGQLDGQGAGSGGKRQRPGQGARGEKGPRGGKGQRGEGGRRGGPGQDGRQGRGGPEMIAKLFERVDVDKNGSISQAEAPQRMKQRFAQMDSNKDKSISKAEFEAAFAKMRGGRGQQGNGQGRGKGGQKGGPEGRQGRGGPQMDPAKLIERLDANKDGMISVDEAPERMKKSFDRLDADSSGTITADELKNGMEKMRQRGGKGKAKGRNKAGEGKNKSPQKPKRPPFGDDLS